MGGRCLHVDQLKDFNVRAQGMTWVKGPVERTGPMPRRECAHPLSILRSCRFLRLEAGVPGDPGVTAPGLVGVVSSSPPGTVQGPSPGMVASIVRAAVPASAPATLRTAHMAQVRDVKDGSPWEGVVDRKDCALSPGLRCRLSLLPGKFLNLSGTIPGNL